MRRVHPLLSPLGIGMTILIFLGLGLSFIKDGSAMFSPGDLTAQGLAGVALDGFTSHADFENECKYCHAPLETSQADLCVRCHTSVMEQIVAQAGTHFGLENIQECRVCHPDHKGRDFDPSAAAFTFFDHAQTGFSLIWHQVNYDTTPLDCSDCHTRENGFSLMLETCTDCHAGNDPVFMAQHRQDFGDDCLICHDGSGEMTNFDHNTTRFPLEGVHAQTDCVGCHLDGHFSGTPIACADCHAEPEVHAGLFSQDCAACHTPLDWAALVGMNGALFDHFTQTNFSLNLHLTNFAGGSMGCADCHNSPDDFKVTFELDFCVNCHTQEDAVFMQEHQTQFGLDCLTCHDGVDRMHDFDHARFFILDGAHADITCESCHVDQLFTSTPADCSACHAEPEIHAGYFGLQCENCHSTTAWSPAQMVAHTFPLDHGEQGLIACEVCHVDRYTEYTCYGCHEHQPGEILSKHLEEGISRGELENCIACHATGLHDEAD
jgi:hypothetical protein